MSENEEKTSLRNGKLTPSYIEVILIVLIVVGGAMYGYDKYFAQKIQIVDMSGYLRQQKALMGAGEITTEDFKENLGEVDRRITQEADLNKNHVFILKEIVLKNGNEFNIK